jgi:hypothetical protein
LTQQIERLEVVRAHPEWRLSLHVETATASFPVSALALVKSAPDSRSRLQEWRLKRCLCEVRVDINVIFSQPSDKDDKEIGQLRVKLKAL